MAGPVLILATALILLFIILYLNKTDIPKIPNLPEIPGYPLFGSLIELGSDHARVAQRWAQNHGPVFQVRMGNKVRNIIHFLEI